MIQALPNQAIHNPFQNRFNFPVTYRRDDMQSNGNRTWLRARNEGLQSGVPEKSVDEPVISDTPYQDSGETIFALFPLVLFLLVSVFLLVKAF